MWSIITIYSWTHRCSLLKVGMAIHRCASPCLHYEFGVSLIWFWSYMVCQRYNSDATVIDCYFWIRSNSRWVFCNIGKLQDPNAARLVFVVVSALGTEWCCWVASTNHTCSSCIRIVLNWTGWNSRTKQERNTKLGTHGEVDLQYWRNSHTHFW